MWLRLSLWVALTVMGMRVFGSPMIEKREPEDTKYFHEPGNTDLTGHYDIRYFQTVVSYETRLDTLKHMVRAWLQTTKKEGIETWIAHGTLLGWWWNGGILPWDWDLDVQMYGPTLKMLGEKYNMTMHKYTSDDGDTSRMYLLDINPHSAERVPGDGMNIIDARWIDVRNGLFIDITGISETHPVDDPGMLYCKNLHPYKYDDIWPLGETLFEGVLAYVPHRFEDILIEEYNVKALLATEYEGHRWNPKTKTWDQAPNVPSGKSGEKALKQLRIPSRYETVEPGGILFNLLRLFHWW